MKRIILALAILALIFPAAQRAEARTDVSIDFFYNNLNDGGNWIEAGDYGYCWQPSVAVSNRSWRPYSDGYWAYTDVGWTWVSYEDFGWATYHYGRWARLREQGWVWVPGREWGPAWVSWRTGGDQVGWAPLPPRYGRGGEVVYEGRGIGSNVDLEFDIGPSSYNFVDVRYIGEPVLRDRIYDSSQNIIYINGTVNVTNITYNNSTFYNYGPDYNQLSAYSTRPIQRMTLERQTNVDYAQVAQSGNLTRVQGDRLIVAGPQLLQAPAPQQQFAPKVVKTRIAKVDVDTGWTADSAAKAELQQKMKKENPKSIPPAKLQPTNPAALTAASVAPNAAPAPDATASPVGAANPNGVMPPNGKGKNKRGALVAPVQPGTSPAGVTDPNATPGAAPNDLKGKGKDKNKRGQNASPAQPLVSQPDGTPEPGPVATPVSVPNDNKGKGKNRGNKQGANPQAVPPAVAPQDGSAIAPAATAVPPVPEQKGKGKNKGERVRPDPATTAPGGGDNGMSRAGGTPDRGLYSPAGGENPGLKKGGERKSQRREVQPPPDAGADAAVAPVQAPPQEQPRRVERQMRQAPPQQVAPGNGPAAPQQDGGKPEKGKKAKKGQEEPAPTPDQ